MHRGEQFVGDAGPRDRAEGLEAGIVLTIHRLSQGGADRVAMLLANGFAEAGVPTTVAVLRSGGEAEDTLLAMLRPDVSVRFAGAPMGSRHLELVRGLRFIRGLTRELRPAVVMASSSNMGLVTGLAGRSGDRSACHVMKLTNPVVRPHDRGPLRRRYRRRLYRFVFSAYDRILVLSDAEAAGLARLYPDLATRFAVVANPYVTDAMFAVAAQPERRAGATVLSLARMMPQKRLDRLLEAFATIADASARLIVLGDGPERGRLTAQAARLGIGDRVSMPGFLPEVTAFLERADVLALSSDYEGLPAAALEALAAGRRVVTTDCFDGARALLDPLPGCAVVARDDVAGFAAALDAALADRGGEDERRAAARTYAIGSAVAAHVAEVRATVAFGTRRAVREPV